MRFADSTKPIKIIIEIKNNLANFIIENEINFNEKISKGGGKGTNRLERLNFFNDFTRFEYRANGNTYNQKLTFKKI